MDRFEDLRTFVALTQTGGFAAAADRLGIVKSAVSRRIRDMEDRLDVRLVQRTSRQLALTDAGRLYLSQAERILDSVRTLDELVRGEARELSGTIRLSLPESFAANCFAQASLSFRERHPEITLEIDTEDSSSDMVRDGIDLALTIARLKDSTFVARRLLDVRHAFCASPSYLAARGRPTSPDDLSQHLCIVQTGPQASGWPSTVAPRARTRSQLRASSCDFVREAARAGAGVALLPTFVIADAVVEGSLEIVLDGFEREPTPLHVLFPASRHVPARVRALIDHLVDHFGPVASWDRRIEAARS